MLMDASCLDRQITACSVRLNFDGPYCPTVIAQPCTIFHCIHGLGVLYNRTTVHRTGHCIFTEGVNWGPKQGYFWTVNWVCAPQLAVYKLGTQRDFGCTRATKLLVAAHMPNCPRREPYISPPFSHISPPTDLISVIIIILLHLSKYYCNKIGAKQSSTWPDTPFWPISLIRKSAKGVPKRWKINLHQIFFSNPRMIWYHKRSPLVLFWDEKRPWLGRGGLWCGNSVPKFELYFCPDHWGGPFGPNFINHLITSFKYLHKKVTFQDICSVDPLW